MSDNHSNNYDPRKRQPQTLGELETWMIADEATSFDVPAPIPLNPPAIPGVDRLSAYCHANYGSPLSFENVRRLIGTFAIGASITTEEARGTAFSPVADLLVPRPPVKSDELRFMELAIEQARQSKDEDGRAHPKVGAVVVKDGVVLASAHRGELGKGDHAEYTALERKLGNEIVAGATVYTTLEPCTSRNHPKIPCAEWLNQRKIQRVVIGMLDPNPAICGKGERFLRAFNIEVERFPHNLILQLEDLNRDFTRAQTETGKGGSILTADNPFRRLVSMGCQISEDERKRKCQVPYQQISHSDYSKLEIEFHKCGAECRVIAKKLPGWNAEEVKKAIADCDDALICLFRGSPEDPASESLIESNIRGYNRFITALKVIQDLANDFQAEQELRRAAPPPKTPSKFSSALEYLESLPPGPQAFKTWEEYERHLQEERNSWDR